MDAIYGNAELTIVAAAGEDQSHGLPGLNSRPRTAQRTAMAGSYRIVETLPDPHHKVSASRWFTRAWTFQEGLLSRRSLIFTDDQIYYECTGMNCSEAIECALAGLHVSGRSEFDSYMRGALLGTNLKYTTAHESFHASPRASREDSPPGS